MSDIVKELKKDIVELLTNYFGPNMGSFIDKQYIDNSIELVEATEELMSKLVGPENARKHLEPILKKHNIKLEKVEA